jgi:hypothetical protein
MKESKVMILSKGQCFWHYAIVFFLLLVPAFTTWSLIQYYILGSYTGVREPHELIAGYFFVVPSVFFYFLQRRRLELKEIPIKIDSAGFIEAAEAAAAELNWVIREKRSDYVLAIRKGSLFSGGSWGEMITMIRDVDSVYVNSICDPDNVVSIASFGWNRRNVEAFVEQITSLHTT